MNDPSWFRKYVDIINEAQADDPFAKAQSYPILMQFITAYNKAYPKLAISSSNTNFEGSAFHNVMDKYFRSANDQRKAELLDLKQKFNIQYYEPEAIRQKSNWLSRFFMGRYEKGSVAGFVMMILLYSFWNLGFTVDNENYVLDPPDRMKSKPEVRDTEKDEILVPLIEWYFGPEGPSEDDYVDEDGEVIGIDDDAFSDVIGDWLKLPGNQERVDRYQYEYKDYDLEPEPDKDSPEYDDWAHERSILSYQKLTSMLNGYVDPDGIEYEIVG
jgi:hypothetical protein